MKKEACPWCSAQTDSLTLDKFGCCLECEPHIHRPAGITAADSARVAIALGLYDEDVLKRMRIIAELGRIRAHCSPNRAVAMP